MGGEGGVAHLRDPRSRPSSFSNLSVWLRVRYECGMPITRLSCVWWRLVSRTTIVLIEL